MTGVGSTKPAATLAWALTACSSAGIARTLRLDGFGDALEHLPGQPLVGRLGRQVAQGDDARQLLVSVEDDEAPQLLVFHQPGRVTNILILKAVDELLRHYLLHSGPGRVLFGTDRPYRNVAIGDYAQECVAVAHRQDADVQLLHLLRRVREGGFGLHNLHVASHDVPELHGPPPEDPAQQDLCRALQ